MTATPGGEPSNPNIQTGVCPLHYLSFERITEKLDDIKTAVVEHKALHEGFEKAGIRAGGKIGNWATVAGLVLAVVLALGSAIWTMARPTDVVPAAIDERTLMRAVRAAMHEGRQPTAPMQPPAGGGE